MVARIGPVETVSATGSVSAAVYRSELSPARGDQGDLDARRRSVAPGDGRRGACRRRLPRRRVGPLPRRGLDRRPPAGSGSPVGGGPGRRGRGAFHRRRSPRPRGLVPSLDSAALVGFEAAGRYLDDEGDVPRCTSAATRRTSKTCAACSRAPRARSTPTRLTSRALGRDRGARRGEEHLHVALSRPRRGWRCSSAASASRT